MRKKNQFYTDSEYMTDTGAYIYNLEKFKQQKKKKKKRRSQNHVHGFHQQ